MVESLEMRHLLTTIADFVWEDLNGNGVRDLDGADLEPGIADVTINLYQDVNNNLIPEPGGLDGAPIASATTADGASAGLFEFAGLDPGRYFFEVVRPDGYSFSPRAAGPGGSTVDSEGLSDIIEIHSAGTDAHGTIVDNFREQPQFVSVTTGTVSSSSGQGDVDQLVGSERDVTITAEGGATRSSTYVNIYSTDVAGRLGFAVPSGILGTAEITWDGLGSPGSGLSIDATRGGLDDRLLIEFVGADLGTTVTVEVEDADGDKGSLAISDLITNADIHFPFTDFVPDASNTDPVDFTSLNAIAIVISGPVSLDATLGPFSTGHVPEGFRAGLIQVSRNLPPAPLLGDFVWEDSDADGIQDDGEAGIEGVIVNLLDGRGDPVLDASNNPVTTTTNADGFYYFGELAAGDYTVEFVLPDGYVGFSPQLQGGDSALDSNPDPTSGVSDLIILGQDETNLTIDAGLIPEAALGDFVWADYDADGVQDSQEPGVAGVTVNLLDGDGNPVLDGSNNPVTTVTDANGRYLFDSLPAGTYVVEFVNPGGYQFSPANQGGDAIDSDADAVTGRTASVTLAPGETNLTVDAGLVPLASLGDYVWLDLDGDGVQDSNEPGVNGVTVTLIGGGADGVIGTGDDTTETTVTADDGSGNAGFYRFTGLTPGVEYQVQFDPGEYVFTQQHAVGDDTLDSDADPTSGLTRIVTLAPGQYFDRLDAGLGLPGINVIKVASGTSAAPFEEVTYTYTVTNTGNVPLDNVTILDDNATPDFDSDDFAPTYVGGDTDGDGLLDVTETWTYEATVIPPVTLTATGVGGGLDGTEVGTIVIEQLDNGDYRFDIIYSETLNDNRYGAGSGDYGWSGKGRRFEQIVSSDHVKVTLTDGNGTVVMDMQVDYLSSTVNKYTSVFELFPGGIGGSGGQNDGVLNVGDASWFMDPSTSLYENFQNGFDETSYPNILTDYVGENVDGYEYRMIYSFTIDDAAFGGNGFGGINIPGMHNSPAKGNFPDGDTDTEIVPQTVTNTVEVTGVYGSATVADTDTATVSINVVSGGSTESSVSSSSSTSGTDTTSSNDKKQKDTSIDDGETQVATSSDALNLTGETESTSNNGNGNSKKKDAYFTDLADDPLRLDLADAVDSLA